MIALLAAPASPATGPAVAEPLAVEQRAVEQLVVEQPSAQQPSPEQPQPRPAEQLRPAPGPLPGADTSRSLGLPAALAALAALGVASLLVRVLLAEPAARDRC
jgi:hypothetical protein